MRLASQRNSIVYSLGDREGCSHVAAVLFKVESAVRLGYTSVTSQGCKWNETFCIKGQWLIDIPDLFYG